MISERASFGNWVIAELGKYDSWVAAWNYGPVSPLPQLVWFDRTFGDVFYARVSILGDGEAGRIQDSGHRDFYGVETW